MGTTFYEGGTPMKPEISRIKKKGQFTIPAHVRESLHLSENDQLEVTVNDGEIILKPVITIPREQAWYWTNEWQKEERQAELEVATGEVETFTDVYEAIKFLREG